MPSSYRRIPLKRLRYERVRIDGPATIRIRKSRKRGGEYLAVRGGRVVVERQRLDKIG
jgi:hypothetical protein